MAGFEYHARNGRFRLYLRSAVIHALGRRASRQARQPAVLDPKQFDYLCSREEEQSHAHWEREWQLHRLRWALRAVAGSFEPLTLQAFEMHVLGGRPVEETAAALAISAGSVYQAKSRVLKGLKQRLATLDPEGDI